MNILMLNYEFPPIGGGASPVSYDIGKRLAEMGHTITVVTMAYQNLSKEEVMAGMKVYRIPCLRTKRMVCHPWEQATYILSAIHFISCKLDVKKYDICYTHFIIPTGVVAWWLKHKYQLKYIITSHGSDVIGHNNKRFKLLYTLVRKPWCGIVRAAEVVVSPSVYLKELMEKNEPNARYQVIQNGVDTEFFARREEKKKNILIMCRLQETKNVQSVLRALTKINLEDWKVRILGDGPYRDVLESYVQENNLGQVVQFDGWVENKSEKHLQALQEASIFISASRVENCPTSILEAISCGTRLLLSDIPAHRQLIADENVFFKLDMDEQLIIKIQQLIDKPDRSNHYESSQFDWKHSIEKYEKLLQDC